MDDHSARGAQWKEFTRCGETEAATVSLTRGREVCEGFVHRSVHLFFYFSIASLLPASIVLKCSLANALHKVNRREREEAMLNIPPATPSRRESDATRSKSRRNCFISFLHTPSISTAPCRMWRTKRVAWTFSSASIPNPVSAHC